MDKKLYDSGNQFADLKDSYYKSLFRSSSICRIVINTGLCAFICGLYAYSLFRYKNLNRDFVKNWIKGSFICSLSFYTLNEVSLALFKYYHLYTNFWINYSLVGYICSKIFYRYLIRNNINKWFEAIKRSHKYFFILVTFSSILDLIVYTIRYIELYDEEDIFDKVQKLREENTKMSYNQFEELFMQPVVLVNTSRKRREILKYMNENSNNSGLKTVDLYDMYKDKRL
jgi:hypothetical protein